MLNFKDVKELLSSPKRIVIIPHKNPDADALGSALGLRGYLLKKGHDASVISPSDYPQFLNWMNGNESVIIFNSKKEKSTQKMINEADIIFCLDFNSLNRIDELGVMVSKSKAATILIDHHLDPDCFADFSYASTEA